MLICNGPLEKGLGWPGERLNDISKMNHRIHLVTGSLSAQRAWYCWEDSSGKENTWHSLGRFPSQAVSAAQGPGVDMALPERRVPAACALCLRSKAERQELFPWLPVTLWLVRAQDTVLISHAVLRQTGLITTLTAAQMRNLSFETMSESPWPTMAPNSVDYLWEGYLAIEPRWDSSVEEPPRQMLATRWQPIDLLEQRTLMAGGTVAASQRTCLCSFYVLPLRNPWSCIFCQIRAVQENCPENQPCHQESEVLERQMLSEEKLVSCKEKLQPPSSLLFSWEEKHSLAGAGGTVPRGKLLSLTVPWSHDLTPTFICQRKCPFRVSTGALCLNTRKSSFSPSGFSRKISSVFCRNVNSSSWRSIPVQKVPFLPQNHTM